MVPVGACLGLSAVLFGIGLIGFLSRRNLLLMLVSVEIMLNAVNVRLAGFSRQLQDQRGPVLALVVLAVAAAEPAVGLGLDNERRLDGRRARGEARAPFSRS